MNKQDISKGAESITATLERTSDLQTNNLIRLQTITCLVSEEAAKMLDKRFEAQMLEVLLKVFPDRQYDKYSLAMWCPSSCIIFLEGTNDYLLAPWIWLP